MSIGRPGSFSDIVNAPPDRGSFPLDHYGECKEQMKAYLACLKQNSATSTPCRVMNRDYLDCRMSKGLMERDEWHNLGLGKVGNGDAGSSPGPTNTPSSSKNIPAPSQPETKKP